MAAPFDSSLDLRLLPSFLALAQELHFSRAAQRLHIAQPALSQQIARLERQVGVQLFDRPPRPIALTPAGRALLDRVTPALAMVEQGVAESRATAGEQPETLTVSHLSSFSVRLVPLIVGTLRATHPRLLLTLHVASLPEQLAALRAGRAQIGLIHTNPDLAVRIPDLQAVTIATGPRMIMLPVGHPLARKHAVVLSDAAAEPFVLPSGDGQTGYRAGIEHACQRYGFTPLAAAQANDTGVILDLVAAGMGVALAPWIATTDLPREVVARPLVDERCELVALTTLPAPATTSALIAAARDAVGKLTTAVTSTDAWG
ncbi:LysR family transcriptional regulator [Actinoplanes sp. TBRC 11911]|uniref:LysR family transcriptional regulator n=1 Tax=Actinoplanes sp. TBRC 11911 TaxID=2729386 RepID=UPI00145C6FD0|nr:LysR substrate-binding domain-containing protein [Actinoplanes sp. TBRC 11911]NMO57555.1 LysR family transcriptional regulator [Actinoplanes sp. TBRC 11911]